MRNVFDELGQFWAEIADQNHTERQIKFLETQLKPDDAVLDLACGTGRHLIPLSEVGFCVVGMDVSRRLLKIARQRGAGALVLGDLRFLPFKEGAFSAAVSMDTSFGYLTTENDDTQSLTETKRALRQGGRIILDLFNRQHLTKKYGGKSAVPKTLEYPSFVLEQKRSISPDGSSLRDEWVVKTPNGETAVFEHIVRLYLRSSLEQMLASAGFIIDTVWGGYEKQPFNSDSSRLILIASAQ